MAARRNKKGHHNPIHPVIDSFRLIAETRRQALEIAESARQAIKRHHRDPQELADFIEGHGTPVVVLQHNLLPCLVMWLLGVEPGFIPPSSGWRYELLGKGLALYERTFHQTGHQGEFNGRQLEHGVFILTRPLFTVGYISHQLHHWLAFRSGMTGYSDRAQQLYRKFWDNNGVIGKEVYKMSLADMSALRSAINRDMEALKFLQDIASEILVPANQAKRISNGTASA